MQPRWKLWIVLFVAASAFVIAELLASQVHAQCFGGSSGASSIVLLDFRADWCGPCRAMEPAVQQLAAAGFPVRRVDIDEQKTLAQQFHVASIPCFVLIVDGREVQRIVGQNDISELIGMFRRAGYETQASRLKPASPIVRVKCPGKWGSGTLIDVDGRGVGMVITNCHVVAGEPSIEVDFSNSVRAAGSLLMSDPIWDVAAIAIQAPANVTPLELADSPPRAGEPLAIAGFGSNDQFLEQRGNFSQFLIPEKGDAAEFLEVAGCSARSGDSGGPILNSRGQLAGMLDGRGTKENITVGPCCTRIRRLLYRWLHPKVSSAPPVSGSINLTVPPPGTAPAALPAVSPAAASAADPLNLTGQLAAIKSELDTLTAGGGANASGLTSINTQLTQLAQQAGTLPALNTALQNLQTQVTGQIASLNKAITPAALQTALQAALPAISATSATTAAAGGLTLAQMLGLGSAAGVPGLLAAGALWFVGNGALKKIAGATATAASTPPPNASPPGGAMSSTPSAGPKPAAPAVQPSTPAIILQNQPATSASQAIAANASAAKPAAPTPQNYVPYQDASINQAWQTAHAAVAKSYPGAIGALQQAERMVPQILSGMSSSLVPETA
jgi:thiol-disulfide isomerase/thioredoxin